MEVEGLSRERFGERVGDVLGRRDVLHVDDFACYQLAYEEVAAIDVLGFRVEYRVEGEVDRGRVVHIESDGRRLCMSCLSEHAGEEDAFAGCQGAGHDFRVLGVEGDGLLFLGAPGNGGE